MKPSEPNDMSCERARGLWELYSDSEGNSQLYQEINEHLARCEACAGWYERQSRFESALSAKLREGTPAANVWTRIEHSLPAANDRSFSVIRVFAAVAACALIALSIWRFGNTSEEVDSDLTTLVSRYHERLATGDEQLQFVSKSDLAVEEYLKRQVTFPVRCPPRQDAGFEVRGGGICTVGELPAAYVHGLVGSDKVSIFILPRERLAEFGHERDALMSADVVYRRQGNLGVVVAAIHRNLVVVVGQEPPERLERVVRAYGTYPDPESHDAA